MAKVLEDDPHWMPHVIPTVTLKLLVKLTTTLENRSGIMAADILKKTALLSRLNSLDTRTNMPIFTDAKDRFPFILNELNDVPEPVEFVNKQHATK